MWLLWTAVAGGCAVAAYRRAEFFFIYRSESVLMAIWSVLENWLSAS